jgi:hypothetical protein
MVALTLDNGADGAASSEATITVNHIGCAAVKPA